MWIKWILYGLNSSAPSLISFTSETPSLGSDWLVRSPRADYWSGQMSVKVVLLRTEKSSTVLLHSAVLLCREVIHNDTGITRIFGTLDTKLFSGGESNQRETLQSAMETNSQNTEIMNTDEDIPSPAQFEGDTAGSSGSVRGLKKNWQKWSHEHQEYQKNNPFSNTTRPSVVVPQRGQDDYGRPLQGSMTEQRGKDAHTHISREVQELCKVIRDIGEPGDEEVDGKVSVEFGKLFEHYVNISNKLVGVLLRARKQRLVDFEGEMLWQGKDDHVVITLLE